MTERDFYPDLRFNFRHPGMTSPRQPQNLPRVTSKGCTNCGKGGAWPKLGLMGVFGLGDVAESTPPNSGVWIGYGLLSTVSAVASGYHGYKRNNSIGWAALWFFLGGCFPIFTPVVAVAQGYAKKA